MSNRNRKWNRCARGAADEFVDALLGRDETEKHFNPASDRKTLQLCRQVQRAISMALAGECADEVLRDVYVDSVVPTGGAAQLLVKVVIPRHAALEWSDVLQRLNAQSGRLRAIVARSINRKRTPNLTFIVISESTSVDEGGSNE